MNRTTLRNTLIAAALAGATALGTVAYAEGGGYGPGYGMGPGMMWGYGPGYYGMGPGMMRGYGPGYYGMGPGMMWGYGPRQQGNTQARDLNSPGGQLFANTCSRCHALPFPSQHTAEEWPGVVVRMKQHMKEAYMPHPNAEQTKEIEQFLEQQTTAKK